MAEYTEWHTEACKKLIKEVFSGIEEPTAITDPAVIRGNEREEWLEWLWEAFTEAGTPETGIKARCQWGLYRGCKDKETLATMNDRQVKEIRNIGAKCAPYCLFVRDKAVKELNAEPPKDDLPKEKPRLTSIKFQCRVCGTKWKITISGPEPALLKAACPVCGYRQTLRRV